MRRTRLTTLLILALAGMACWYGVKKLTYRRCEFAPFFECVRRHYCNNLNRLRLQSCLDSMGFRRTFMEGCRYNDYKYWSYMSNTSITWTISNSNVCKVHYEAWNPLTDDSLIVYTVNGQELSAFLSQAEAMGFRKMHNQNCYHLSDSSPFGEYFEYLLSFDFSKKCFVLCIGDPQWMEARKRKGAVRPYR